MADITVTAANVQEVAGASTQTVTYGATITQGQSLYLDTSVDKWKLADCDSTAATAGSGGVAIALTSGADGQKGIIVTSGNVDLGATLTVGEIYVLSGNAGGIAPEGDLASNDYVVVLGVATAADNLKMQIINSGVQVP